MAGGRSAQGAAGNTDAMVRRPLTLASAPRQTGAAAPAVAESTADPGCGPDPRPVRLGRSAAGLCPGRDPAGQAAAACHPALRLVFPQCLPESDAADAEIGRAHV